MKIQITIIIILLTTALISGCVSNNEKNLNKDINLLCEPIVVASGINYSSDPKSVPYGETHSNFSKNYTGSDLSIELRDTIIQNMTEKTNDLGENSTILFEAIKVTYNDSWDERPIRIPCYAEKAVFNNESVWIIAFNRANSFEGMIGHYDIYFVSIPIIKAQYISGSNPTSIVHHYGCR
jgi:hypothetical protein